MKYQIQNKNDLTAGATLVISVPERDIDRKAILTLQEELPKFIVPFRVRNVDGQVELTYLLGSRSKLQYFFGGREPNDYINMWENILTPLLECDDWFMNPFSFLLELQYLYCDKGSKAISYIYIPTNEPCSDFEALKQMAMELSKLNPVSDPTIENAVLRTLMQDFNPREFLQMLKRFKVSDVSNQKPGSQIEMIGQREFRIPEQKHEEESFNQPAPSPPIMPAVITPTQVNAEQIKSAGGSDDIVINFKRSAKPEEKPKGFSFFGGKKDKDTAEEKPKKQKKEKKPLPDKADEQREIIMGAAAMPSDVAIPQYQPVAPVMPQAPAEYDEITQIEGVAAEGTLLRLVGDASLPREIKIEIALGQVFTIGRFDVSLGRAQSSFEFDKKTKAISRRHAAIERDSEGYFVVDLTSSAGTFLNGQKLTPNAPQRLETGVRISFGNGGADYVWNE